MSDCELVFFYTVLMKHMIKCYPVWHTDAYMYSQQQAPRNLQSAAV